MKSNIAEEVQEKELINLLAKETFSKVKQYIKQIKNKNKT